MKTILFSHSPPLSITRKPYVDEISKINENFMHLSPSNKLRFLYFNDELDDKTERIAADLHLALVAGGYRVISGIPDGMV